MKALVTSIFPSLRLIISIYLHFKVLYKKLDLTTSVEFVSLAAHLLVSSIPQEFQANTPVLLLVYYFVLSRLVACPYRQMGFGAHELKQEHTLPNVRFETTPPLP
jgi:hypothetical protein